MSISLIKEYCDIFFLSKRDFIIIMSDKKLKVRSNVGKNKGQFVKIKVKQRTQNIINSTKKRFNKLKCDMNAQLAALPNNSLKVAIKNIHL